MIEMLFALLIFLGGFGLGLAHKGITININKNGQAPKDIGYNESTVTNLDPEVRQYYESNNGLNRF